MQLPQARGTGLNCFAAAPLIHMCIKNQSGAVVFFLCSKFITYFVMTSGKLVCGVSMHTFSEAAKKEKDSQPQKERRKTRLYVL